MKKSVGKVNKKEVLVKEREDKWMITPCHGIPEYLAEKDPHCPTGQIRKFNEEKRLKAEILSQRDKATTSFIRGALDHSMEEIHLDAMGVSGGKAVHSKSRVKTKESFEEIEILQKIVVRENLLMELQQLLKSQNDITVCLTEVVELVKAVRFQTLDVVEDIHTWQKSRATPCAFQYKGFNYLVKIKGDLDFLDYYEEIVERFCFEFKSNPLAYRGGGNVISGYGYDTHKKSYSQGLLRSYYSEADDDFLDGLEVSRLLNAEKIVQAEFDRIAREKLAGRDAALSHAQQSGQQGDVLDREIFKELANASAEGQPDVGASGEGQIGGRGKQKTKKGEKKQSTGAVNPKKAKQERIAALMEEASELKAMIVNVDEKIRFLTDHHHDLLNQRAALEARLKDAKALGREAAAQHIAAELSVNGAVVIDNSTKMKDLQRESYFINLERKRKLGTAQKLREELEDDKRRASLQKKIAAKIKKEGLLAALQTFNTKATVEEIATLGDKALGKQPTSASATARPTSSSNVRGSGGSPKSAERKARGGKGKADSHTDSDRQLNSSASAPAMPSLQSYWTQGAAASLHPALVECEEEDEEHTSSNKLTLAQRAVQGSLQALPDLTPQEERTLDDISAAEVPAGVNAESGGFPAGADASAAAAAQRRYELLYGDEEVAADEYDVSRGLDGAEEGGSEGEEEGEDSGEEKDEDGEGDDGGEETQRQTADGGGDGEPAYGRTSERHDEYFIPGDDANISAADTHDRKPRADSFLSYSASASARTAYERQSSGSDFEPTSPPPRGGTLSYANPLGSPSDASLDGSKLVSPLNYSYTSTADLDGQASVRRRRFSSASGPNEMYISDDEETHEHSGHQRQAADDTSLSSPTGGSAQQVSSPFHGAFNSPDADFAAGSTYGAIASAVSDSSLSPLSLCSPAGVKHRDDSFISPDSVDGNHAFYAAPHGEPSNAHSDPSRQLFSEVGSAIEAAAGVVGAQGEVAYPAGGAYAVVRSLKLSPRPNLS